MILPSKITLLHYKLTLLLLKRAKYEVIQQFSATGSSRSHQCLVFVIAEWPELLSELTD